MFLSKDEGFILTDILLAFSCLLLTVTIMTPSIVKINSIQSELAQALIAEHLLNQELLYHFKQNDHQMDSVLKYPINHNQLEYTVLIKPLDHKYLGCMYWTNNNEREKRICRYVPKLP